MKSIRSFSLFKVLVLAIATIGASAIPAHAQLTTGTFTLTHKVRWVDAVLPAGNYEFSLESQNWPTRVTVRQVGGPVVVMMMSQVTSEDSIGGASTLVLHEEGGESVVSALRLKSIGMALQFASPKLVTPTAETAALGPVAITQAAK
jgi:hypothetical protein